MMKFVRNLYLTANPKSASLTLSPPNKYMIIIHHHDDDDHHHYLYIIITIKTNIIICITSTVIINHSFTHISANPRRYLQLARYSSASNLDESYDFPDDEKNRYINYINYHQSLSVTSSQTVSHH